MHTRTIGKKYVLDLETPLNQKSATRTNIYSATSLHDETIIYTIKAVSLSDLKSTDRQNVIKQANLLRDASNHQNIATTLDIIEEEDILYTVFPPFDYDLPGYLRVNNGGLQEGDAKLIFRQIVNIALYFHRNNNIKQQFYFQPANFLINSLTHHVVLADLDSNLWERAKTQYLAPEMRIQDELIDPNKSKVYNLGVLLFYLVSGRLPFDDEDGEYYYSWVEKFYEPIDTDDYNKLRRPLPPVPLSSILLLLLEKMIALDPKDRFSLVEVSRHQWVRSHTFLRNIVRRVSALF
eukprot:TRINITY_DN10374_c0_g1_i1.p1 TRINITY_DN10374_c0_g1~~TRINITY_DN10374_c0_g1_i1.p1  ORF type:complete len:300 (+),score=39.73 TRINITY_DN10374_c0_g1_i1:22-900(+)